MAPDAYRLDVRLPDRFRTWMATVLQLLHSADSVSIVRRDSHRPRIIVVRTGAGTLQPTTYHTGCHEAECSRAAAAGFVLRLRTALRYRDPQRPRDRRDRISVVLGRCGDSRRPDRGDRGAAA